MPEFPAFMKNRVDRIATSSQHTPGVEGYVFDGADGSQMAFWTVERDAITTQHVHEFDEEYVISRGTRIGGHVTAGTRTIHAFGGRRAERSGKP